MTYWMVIYPRGDRSRLSVAQVQDCEINDWALASAQTFHDEEDCREHMVYLANRHGLRYNRQQDYLD